jgi:hypothetical protein
MAEELDASTKRTPKRQRQWQWNLLGQASWNRFSVQVLYIPPWWYVKNARSSLTNVVFVSSDKLAVQNVNNGHFCFRIAINIAQL